MNPTIPEIQPKLKYIYIQTHIFKYTYRYTDMHILNMENLKCRVRTHIISYLKVNEPPQINPKILHL